jgi:MFS family permease
VVVAAVLGLMTVSDAFVYLTFQRRSGWAAGSFPLLFVGTALAYLALAVPVGRLADRRGRAPVFLAGYLLLAAAYVVLRGAGPGLPTLVLLLGLLGAYYAATDGVLMAMASAVVPDELRTSGLALLTTVTASARLVASLLFGLLWTWRGMDGALTFFLSGLLVAIPLAGALLVREGARP